MADKKRYNERADRGDVNKKQKADECRGKGKIGKCRGSGAGGIGDKGKGKIGECSRSGVGDYDDEWEKNYQEDYGPDHDDPNSKEVDYGDSPPEDENEDEDEFPRSPYNGVGVNVRGREVLSDNSDDDTGGAGAGEVDVQEQGNFSGLVDDFSKLDPFQGFADGSKNKDDEYKKDNKEEEATQLLRTIDVAGTSVQTELILNLPDLGEWCMKI